MTTTLATSVFERLGDESGNVTPRNFLLPAVPPVAVGVTNLRT